MKGWLLHRTRAQCVCALYLMSLIERIVRLAIVDSESVGRHLEAGRREGLV